MERAYSDGVIKNLFLNAVLKVRMVENPVCPAISVMLKDGCFSSLAASSRRCILIISQKPMEKY